MGERRVAGRPGAAGRDGAPRAVQPLPGGAKAVAPGQRRLGRDGAGVEPRPGFAGIARQAGAPCLPRPDRRAPHPIVGMEKAAPSLIPLGQRAVTVLVRVWKRKASVPCWLRSPKPDFFHPPKVW